MAVRPCLMAQRKEMAQARSYIKSGKDFGKAEKLLRELLAKDSLSRMNPKVYLLLYQAVLEQYEVGNEKLYLKQQYDTASLFNLAKSMFAIYESLDSVDMLPDKKGRVKLEYRKRHAAELDTYRPNLFYGGTYNVRKGDFKTAFSFFDTYLDCGNQPLFSKFDYWASDGKMADAAYWATYCGFRLKDPKLTLKYSDVALRDTSAQKHRTTLVYVSAAYSWLKDAKSYMEVLRRGFALYSDSPYFFSHLIDCYTDAGRLDSALVVADRAIAADPDNTLFLFAKSSVLLNMGRYDECVAVSDSIICLNDTLAEPYYNAGIAYVNKANVLGKGRGGRGNRKVVRELYSKALPYMENYRRLAPGKKQKWGPALYKIYFYLNKGKQFEEVDSLLN